MSKVVKLKLSDIENIVKKTIKESELEDFDAQSQDVPSDEPSDENQGGDRNVAIGKGEDGKIYVTDLNTGEILGVK